MTTLFRLDASIRTEGSVTRAVADSIETEVLEGLGRTDVTRRDVGVEPIDAGAWGTAAFAGYTPQEQRSPAQVAALALSTQLADEVLAADVLLFAVPMYNFGVSQHFKAWVDQVIADPRLGPGSTALAGRPAFLVTARGGGYGAGTPREGWDHATSWMRRILADVWQLDLDVVETELTLAEVTPQMEGLRELARRQLAESHETAKSVGRSVTLKLSSVG